MKKRSVPLEKWLSRIVIVGISLFIITSIQRFSVHPSGGHTQRQSDSIGMSMAFAEELKTRGLGAFDFFIYPKVLQKGPYDGINASEFPLLNVLIGPLFLLGSPWLGVFLGSLLVLIIHLITAYSIL